MFFGETLNSQSVSLIFLPPLPSLSSINGRRQTVSEMLEGTGERRGGGGLAMDWDLIQEG